MKTVTCLLVLIIGLFSCQSDIEKKSEPNIKDEPTIESLEKEGFDLFQKHPDKAIIKFVEVSEKSAAAGNLKKVGITNLNIASIYDEYLNKKDSALLYANKSLATWSALDDTLQQANLYKYIGLLKGNLKEYAAAKSSIKQAIELYEAVSFKQGVAVSEFNLANVYLSEGNLDESALWFEKSLQFWRTQKNNDRIFSNNLLGIELYAKKGAPQKVKEIIKENTDLLNSVKLNDFLKNKFNTLIEEYGA